MLTDRLELKPVTPEMKAAMQASRAAFAASIAVSLPDDWPQFPEAFTPGGRQPRAPWTGYLFVLRDAPILIGNGGFVSEPDETGTVEIGYEIAPTHWNRGYATEAAAALVRLAFEAGATAVIAHSLAETNASNGVMRKLGMTFIEELPADEVGAIWRWRIERPAS